MSRKTLLSSLLSVAVCFAFAGNVFAANLTTLDKLGVGTTTPTSKITATEGGTEFRYGKEGTFAVLRLQDPTSASNTSIIVRNSARTWQVRLRGDDGNKFEIFDATAIRRVMVFDSAGNVGIGTATPADKLHVLGNIRTSATMSAAIVEIRGAGADLAEGFKINNAADAIKPGMVVSISPEHDGEMMLSTKAYDRTVAGIISGAGDLRPGIQLGYADEVAAGTLQPVALTGRVWCYADASSGAIEPGDLLTTSATPGHAMKVADYQLAQGSIIGKAMTGINAETGMVLVLVSLQ